MEMSIQTNSQKAERFQRLFLFLSNTGDMKRSMVYNICIQSLNMFLVKCSDSGCCDYFTTLSCFLNYMIISRVNQYYHSTELN